MIKKIIKSLSLTLLVLVPLLGLFLINDAAMAMSPMDKQPWVHWNGLNPSNEVFISWETETNSSTYLLYGTDVNFLNTTLSDSNLVSLHRMKLTGLSPNTQYYFQVSNDNGASVYGKGSFKTAPTSENPENFTFVLASDAQNFWGTGHYPRIAKAVSKLSNISFFAHAGDMAQDHGQTSLLNPDSEQVTWNDFWRHTNHYSPNIPIVPNPGNHDDCNQPFESNYYQRYFGISTAPNHNYYTFNWSRTQFVMAQIADGGDEDIHNESTHATYMQDEWINATLEAGQVLDYRIMVFHRTFYSSNGNVEKMINRFMPILEKYNVSMIIMGHEHIYERFYIQNQNILCLGAGGGLMNVHITPQEGSQCTNIGPSFTTITCTNAGITLRTLTPTLNVIEEMHFTNVGSKLVPDNLIK